ncbi:MAG: phosphatidate cytidylyltransferase [Alphaproteobacteria bacterium]|nr:phosphatidate cytidylyltransferase [Alphaproteobacteria bacterium]
MFQKETAIRLITALILLPLLAVIWFGGMAALVLALGFVLFMTVELTFSARAGRFDMIGMLIVVTISMPAGLALWAGQYDTDPAGINMAGINMAGTLMALAIFFVGLFSFRHISGMIMMLLLAGLGLSLIAMLRLDHGGIWLVLALVTVAVVDTMGFLVGRKLGGAKLWPAISPAKTWSGAIGGVLFSPVPILIYAVISGEDMRFALFGVVLAILAIAGDLMESWYKRCHDLKDIGRILPGHGGMLDRFDGSLLAIPMLYLLLANGWLG